MNSPFLKHTNSVKTKPYIGY